ncbi:MAG: GDP-mannose 4,6-dehydratase [Candidatus Nanoarchaeia archaeon]|nr:GDP-mannose 4,6-dehydratase [Candidatus Nanoarchaeia archaeon]
MKIMITGGAGFIGSNLAKELAEEGHEVIVIDDFSYGSMLNLDNNGESRVEIHNISICDEKILEIMKGVDYVYHFAAISCLPICLSQPAYTTNVNVAGTLNILEAARLNNIKRVIFASSSAVYENNEKFPLKEEDDVNPFSIYGVQKYSGELFCKAYRKLYGMDIVILRFFNVYGPNQDYTRQKPPVMSSFIRELIKGKGPIIYGTGEQKRDFIFIGDVTALNKKLIEKESAKNETFNVGSGKTYSVNEIYTAIERILKTGIKPLRREASELYEGIKNIETGMSIKKEMIAKENNKFTEADTSKAKRLLGWEPKMDLEKGIIASIEFIRNMIKMNRNF